LTRRVAGGIYDSANIDSRSHWR